MPQKRVQPSISEVAFDCPHCGAYTHQTWFDGFAKKIASVPIIYAKSYMQEYLRSKDIPEEHQKNYRPLLEKRSSGLIYLDEEKESTYTKANNFSLSQCYTCGKIAAWINDQLVFPAPMEADPPNSDMPEDVRIDYEEAGRIINLSPRGSAALLRLAIQKLCIHLGEPGKKLDKDIESLMKKGLLPVVQQSLESVRVIGNEAVHPGTMDIKDSRDTALLLFKLVNIIIEYTISYPKQAQAVYDLLPESKKKVISDHDGKP